MWLNWNALHHFESVYEKSHPERPSRYPKVRVQSDQQNACTSPIGTAVPRCAENRSYRTHIGICDFPIMSFLLEPVRGWITRYFHQINVLFDALSVGGNYFDLMLHTSMRDRKSATAIDRCQQNMSFQYRITGFQ